MFVLKPSSGNRRDQKDKLRAEDENSFCLQTAQSEDIVGEVSGGCYFGEAEVRQTALRTEMHRLRTCVVRFRPLSTPQNVWNVSQWNLAGAQRTFQPHRCYTAPVTAEPFLNGTSSNYVEEMYYAWLENPKSVHKVNLSAGNYNIPLVQVVAQSFWLKSRTSQMCNRTFHMKN